MCIVLIENRTRPRAASTLTIIAIVALAAILFCVSSQSADVIVHSPKAIANSTFSQLAVVMVFISLTNEHSDVTNQEKSSPTNPINVDSRSESHEVVEKLEDGIDECLDTSSGDSNVFEDDVDVVADKSVSAPLRELDQKYVPE